MKPVALIATFLGVSLASPLVAVAQTPKPNIVLVLMDNLGYGELGCLRRRHPARRADAAHRHAGRRGHAAAQLQRRGAMHAQPRGADDRPLRHALRQRLSATRAAPLYGLTQWEVTIAELLSAAGLCHGHLRQVAPRPHRGPLPDRPGLRRVVRHPQLAPTRASWTDNPLFDPKRIAYARAEYIMEGRKGEKPQQREGLRPRSSAG